MVWGLSIVKLLQEEPVGAPIPGVLPFRFIELKVVPCFRWRHVASFYDTGIDGNLGFLAAAGVSES
jgi:hypothetical protein